MMDNTTEEIAPSPLDEAQIDYIDPKELTDTTELVMPEPMLDKIADVVREGIAAVTASDEDKEA